MSATTIRPRSISYDSMILKGDNFKSELWLDSAKLIKEMIPWIPSLDVPFAVNVTDGLVSSTYMLKTFTSKNWPVNNGFVTLGMHRFAMRGLTVKISMDARLIEDSPLMYSGQIKFTGRIRPPRRIEKLQAKDIANADEIATSS